MAPRSVDEEEGRRPNENPGACHPIADALTATTIIDAFVAQKAVVDTQTQNLGPRFDPAQPCQPNPYSSTTCKPAHVVRIHSNHS